MWRFTTCFTDTGRKNPQTRPQSKKARASCRSHSRLVFGIPQRSPLFVLFLSYSFSVRNKGYLILYHRFRMGLPAVVLFILKRFCTYHLAQLVFVDRHGPSRFAVMNKLCRVHGLGKSKLQNTSPLEPCFGCPVPPSKRTWQVLPSADFFHMLLLHEYQDRRNLEFL